MAKHEILSSESVIGPGGLQVIVLHNANREPSEWDFGLNRGEGTPSNWKLTPLGAPLHLEAPIAEKLEEVNKWVRDFIDSGIFTQEQCDELYPAVVAAIDHIKKDFGMFDIEF